MADIPRHRCIPKYFGNADAQGVRGQDGRYSNYLTHYDPALAAHAALREEMLPLVFKLAALFQLHLLQLVGIDVARIEKLIASNCKLGWCIGLDPG
jgi:hypothetical protein